MTRHGPLPGLSGLTFGGLRHPMNRDQIQPNRFDRLYQGNLVLSQREFALQRIHLQSMPRYLSLVLGNQCNLDCPYCYQAKNRDRLLGDPTIGAELRRELQALYPYLSTLRIQGGEVFLISGFRELIQDVASQTQRPLLSISTNGTLMTDDWAARLVDTPFQSVTFSIDGATAETYERLRRGGRFATVLDNVRRLQDRKASQGSPYPAVDFFFLLMRSTYREVPRFLELARDLGVKNVTFQTVHFDNRNLSRAPWIESERLETEDEIRELHQIFRLALQRWRAEFSQINLSGLRTLFESYKLEVSFLEEETHSLYPDRRPSPASDPNPAATSPTALAPSAPSLPDEAGPRLEAALPPKATPDEAEAAVAVSPCPNPWSMLYVTEAGDVHTCFLAQPIGNLYEAPLLEIWNSRRALSVRSHILSGRHRAAGCSLDWCAWREGLKAASLDPTDASSLTTSFRERIHSVLRDEHASPREDDPGPHLTAVRRRLVAERERIEELEANLVDLCDQNQRMLDATDLRSQQLAARVAELESRLRAFEDHQTFFADRWFGRVGVAGTSSTGPRALLIRALSGFGLFVQKVRNHIEFWVRRFQAPSHRLP